MKFWPIPNTNRRVNNLISNQKLDQGLHCLLSPESLHINSKDKTFIIGPLINVWLVHDSLMLNHPWMYDPLQSSR